MSRGKRKMESGRNSLCYRGSGATGGETHLGKTCRCHAGCNRDRSGFGCGVSGFRAKCSANTPPRTPHATANATCHRERHMPPRTPHATAKGTRHEGPIRLLPARLTRIRPNDGCRHKKAYSPKRRIDRGQWPVFPGPPAGCFLLHQGRLPRLQPKVDHCREHVS